jgi:UDP-2,3-diacylglucosamine hydrolase
MRDIFLADAHLLDPAAENYRRLLAFLEGLTGSTRTLYLLGDIFDFWVGYRHVVFTPYVPLLEALRRLHAAGTKIVCVEGNHDFHLGPWFTDVLGGRILPDGGTVDLDGRRVHLGHGDLVDAADRGYRLLRSFLRCRPMRWLMAAAPPDLTWAVARWASRQSQKGHAKARPRAAGAMIEKYARDRIAEGCDAVVTGHFHTPLLRELDGGTLVALGDWIEQYSYAVWENGRFELKRF